jgi:hypothetical protein
MGLWLFCMLNKQAEQSRILSESCGRMRIRSYHEYKDTEINTEMLIEINTDITYIVILYFLSSL